MPSNEPHVPFAELARAAWQRENEFHSVPESCGYGWDELEPEVQAAAIEGVRTVIAGMEGFGWRPPPRVIETAEAIAQERTGTVIRSRQGDIGSVDHGPNGEWIGPATLVHLLDQFAGMGLSVADLSAADLASTFPYLVLWEPEEATGDR